MSRRNGNRQSGSRQKVDEVGRHHYCVYLWAFPACHFHVNKVLPHDLLYMSFDLICNFKRPPYPFHLNLIIVCYHSDQSPVKFDRWSKECLVS